jgi:hypothetical protein
MECDNESIKMDIGNITNMSSIQSVVYYTNNATDGILITGGVIVFFIIILMILIKNGEPIENAMAVTSWAIFLFSAMLWYAHLLDVKLMLLFLFLTAATSLYLYATRRQ